jgi:hypothetical protein
VRKILVVVAVVWLVAGCGAGGHGRPAGGSSVPADPMPVSFRTPQGFEATRAYRILVPLGAHRETQWRVPAGTQGLDVIFVNSYVLDHDTDGWSTSRLTAQVRDYATTVAARRPAAPVTATTVAGLPAYQQHIDQPDGSRTLHYDATYVFLDQFLVQVGCQWRHDRPTIEAGCRRVLSTLVIGAV